MQNKGIVRFFAIALTLICVYYLSFSFATSHYDNKAKAYANGDAQVEQDYLDSLANERVWLWKTLKECREMEIGLGLDLKGGMNVVLEISVPEVIKVLADNKTDEAFNQALNNAAKQAVTSQDDVVTLFVREYHRLAPGATLAQLFATQQLRDKVNPQSTDADVEKVLRAEIKSAIDNSYNVLRTRIDRFGVVQPNIQSLEDKMGRIMVELPGIKEPERVRKLLQGSANLEFWETYNANEVLPYLQSADNMLHTILTTQAMSEEQDSTQEAEEQQTEGTATENISDRLKAQISSSQSLQEKEEQQYKLDHPLFSILSPNPYQGAIVGYSHYKDTAQVNRYLEMPEVRSILPRDLQLKWGVSPTENDPKLQTFELYAIKSTERSGRAPLEGNVIVTANDDYDQHGKPCVNMSMNTEGARLWAQLTRQNIGKSIAIVLDGYVYSAPTVQNEITGGNSVITGNFTPEQTKDLANVLRSGKMPAPAHIVQEDIVGPSLGAASIRAGFISCLVAFIMLMVYMCSVYGFIPGMVANGALLMNMFFTFGILTSFQAALTMSGIAGLVLSIGMAVDANVLIYERTKEELRSGKGVRTALTDGYKNAFWTIFDANFTSIITGIILFYFGTGPIRGFATTLIIGISISFFTAIYMTRLVYDYFMKKDKWLHLTFETKLSRGVLQDTHYDFMGRNKIWMTTVVALILVCVGFLGIRGLSQSIDFTGGRNYQVRFDQPIEPEQVRELMVGQLEDANVSVIAIGTDGKTVRITTNYRIDEEGNNIDSEIEAKMYELLKPLLNEKTTLEQFIDRDNQEGGTIISSQKVGPSIADDTTVAAIWSVIFAVLAIGLYILFRFRNVAFSIGSIAALAFDAVLILGVYSMLWGIMPFSMEIDQTFIGAILTAIGYSINDKVVIFDRVREYLRLYPKRDNYQLFNDSLNSTLTRTLFTGSSTLMVLIIIFLLGGESIRSFSFAMIIGVAIGTFSSLFVGSPIAYSLMKRGGNKQTKE